MSKFRQSKQFLLLGPAFIFFGIAGVIHSRYKTPELEVSKQQSALNLSEDLYRYFSLGNKRLFTDLLWIQTLIESDIEHYAKKDLNGWLFLRFRTISQLDPFFYHNYLWGGRYLSIIKDDVIGAVSLLERGVLYYPRDYRLLNTLAFSYFYELGDYDNGIKQLEKIVNDPQAPEFYKSLLSKMRIEKQFDYDTELNFIREFIEDTKEPFMKKKLNQDYYALKAERDLKCLNHQGKNCDTIDGNGEKYVLLQGRFHSRTPFLPYRLKKKGDFKAKAWMTTVE